MMNASRFAGQLRFDLTVELLAAPVLPIFLVWIFPPGFLLLNAARDRAGFLCGGFFLTLGFGDRQVMAFFLCWHERSFVDPWLLQRLSLGRVRVNWCEDFGSSVGQIYPDTLGATVVRNVLARMSHQRCDSAKAFEPRLVGINNHVVVHGVGHRNSQVGIRGGRMKVEGKHQRPPAINEKLIVFV